MEPNTPQMDAILKVSYPREPSQKLPTAADEIMEVALRHYQSIVNLADKKGITIDMRTDFRANALSLVSIITKQKCPHSRAKWTPLGKRGKRKDHTNIQQETFFL
ncbi:hypothetical protein CEXT_527151 [Caerostris extrusa]|uniref:Uncharacterized protein n=1 Tax=Caerostris extrusa TaxID=172846 RepID=A0AAV4X789_CAEEX|nr:hypothetical protein CEXT_527151 [Caerostris extrusa]